MDYPRLIGHIFTGFLIFSCLAAPASAISISDVGAVDKLLGTTTLSNSGIATEESWVSDVLGYAASIDFRDNTNAGSGWELVDGSQDHWAHGLGTDPAYYVLKLGVGKSGAAKHYLYENKVALSWAVIDLSEMLMGQHLDMNFGRISHISEFDSTTSLSEPGSFVMLLFGFGLLCAVIAKKSHRI